MIVESLTGVYHADGTVTGELKYALGKMLGTAHCALCDITHRGISEKGDFERCRDALPVPLSTVHLDERDDSLRAFTEGKTPCVVAHTAEGLVMVLDEAALDACGGDVVRFRDALEAAMEAGGLVFGAAR